MVTLVLPGYSPMNKKWADETAQSVKLEGTIRPVYWDHWDDPTKKFKPREKARLLGDISRNLVINLVAKSLGSLVASYIISDHIDQIGKVIFCGIPLNDIDDEEKETIKNAIKSLPPEKIICFQNEDDAHGTYEQVKNFIDKINNKIEVVSKNGADHEYPYYDEFETFFNS